MKICVLLKQVPDKNHPLTISDDHRSLEDDHITWVSNESDNYALEEALLMKEAHGGEVVACTLGRSSAEQVLKDAMAKGADRSIFLSDEKFDDLDIKSWINLSGADAPEVRPIVLCLIISFTGRALLKSNSSDFLHPEASKTHNKGRSR